MKKLLIFPLLACLAMAGCAALPEAAETAAAYLENSPAGEVRVDLDAPDAPVSGVSFLSGVLTIESAGVYRLSGSFSGQVAVDADGPVELVLDGADITGPACVSVLSKYPVTITAEAGTVNTLSDGAGQPDNNASAAVYSKAPLTIGGEGSLTVNAGANNGIQCKDALTVSGGTLTVTAANNALKSQGPLTVSGGDLYLTCGGDGLNAQDGRLTGGDVSISGGSLYIRSDSRGIDAQSAALISGGSVTIQSADDGIRAADIGLTGGDVAISTVTAAASNEEEAPDDPLSDTADSETGDGLKGERIAVSGGSLAIQSADEAIQGSELVSVAGGVLSLTSAGNGISSDGSIDISDGVLSLDAALDGLQAADTLTVSGGTLDIVTGGGGGGASSKSGESFGPFGSSGTQAEEASAKGLKSDGDIYISGGSVSLSTADDGIHCAVLCTIDGGELTILSSDDAIHADDMLVINGGDIHITDSFEGLEAFAVEVNGGNIIIRSVNDGINANGPETMFGGPGMTQQAAGQTDSISGQSTTYFRQTGGSIDLVVTGSWNNVGDGVDSNGSVFIEGGVLVVSTLGTTQEGAIDKGGGELLITGGMVIAGGSSMMQESISESSTQCCAVLSVSTQAGGTVVAIRDADGNEIWSATMANAFNCLIVTHPDMTPGNVYTVTYGSESTTLDFTSATVINMAGGFGFGGFSGGPPGR